MHTIEQSQDSLEGVELEVFSALSIAGVHGRVKGVLSEDEILFERRTGHTLQLRLNAIRRLRHHHTSLIPRWTLLIGLVLLYCAVRVFVGQPAILMLFSGAAIIFVFFMGRRPTLTIDTESGDCHTLFGNDASLMRMCYLVKRLQSGCDLIEARKGLELLEREADYPAISPIEGALFAAGDANLEAPSVLEAFLMNDAETNSQRELIPEWAAKESGSPISITEPIYTERVTEVHNEFEPVIPAPFARAETVRQEMQSQQHHHVQAPNPWSQQNIGYQQNVQPQQPQAHSEPSFDGFDMFSEGGIFDDPAPPTTNVANQNPWQNPAVHQTPQQPAFSDNHYATQSNTIDSNIGIQHQPISNTNTHSSSYKMIEQKRNETMGHSSLDNSVNNVADPHQKPSGFIPSFLSPLSHGERQDQMMRFDSDDENDEFTHDEILPPAAGLVAGARKEGMSEIVDAEIVGSSETKLGQFPHMQRLAEQRNPVKRRIRVRSELQGHQRTQRSIRNMLLPTVNRLGQLASSTSRIFKRRKTEPSDNPNSQTTRSLRSAAEQSYQSQIADEIARLTKANGGVLPDDVTEQLLRHIGNGKNNLTAGPEEIPSSFSEMSSSSEAARKERDIPGIQRMDKIS